MNMNDMLIISTDDHICEPPTLFDNQLSGDLLAQAPKLKTDSQGKNYWQYQGYIRPSVGRSRNTAWSPTRSSNCATVDTTSMPVSTTWMSTALPYR